MFRFIRNMYLMARDHMAFRKKLKEMRKRDPYIYK